MTREFRKDIRGRGASSNIPNRFDSLHFEAEPQDFDNYLEEEKPRLQTQVLKDSSRAVLTKNDSPDIGFTYSVNPYRGCEHGCIYCYARPTHEYLGMSAGLDFESKIMVKENAPELLEEALMKKSWEPQVIVMSGVTDCYQPLEREYKLTRGCLEVLNKFKNPGAIITKNHLVTRDIDILQEMAQYKGIVVTISITSLDTELIASLEPRTSRPAARLRAIEELAKAGIPVGVNVAPMILGLTDHEMPAILKAAADAGATSAGYTMLRLPHAVAPLFEEWLDVHRPLRKNKVIEAVKDVRDGKMYKSDFGNRMTGTGPRAEQLAQVFEVYSRKYKLNAKNWSLSAAHFKRPPTAAEIAAQAQLSFDLE
ncbi:PA0069 family radical SAM protein [Bdellovibrio sp. SKB1291214]|uniref:PA0069 family radical SAM protein n=1 Tax=Bdellovibrio sp. SKB1291214 TaxID=1732569 RepID=UPI000B515FCB|nr:PA0069 family radical SAM protein [Bdellovibrio sp. SKB1291214]UYL10569.1 PA0069 family radical SAM protein [Bdellovibrio sp. SKB1291214]